MKWIAAGFALGLLAMRLSAQEQPAPVIGSWQTTERMDLRSGPAAVVATIRFFSAGTYQSTLWVQTGPGAIPEKILAHDGVWRMMPGPWTPAPLLCVSNQPPRATDPHCSSVSLTPNTDLRWGDVLFQSIPDSVADARYARPNAAADPDSDPPPCVGACPTEPVAPTRPQT